MVRDTQSVCQAVGEFHYLLVVRLWHCWPRLRRCPRVARKPTHNFIRYAFPREIHTDGRDRRRVGTARPSRKMYSRVCDPAASHPVLDSPRAAPKLRGIATADVHLGITSSMPSIECSRRYRSSGPLGFRWPLVVCAHLVLPRCRAIVASPSYGFPFL